MLFLTISSHSNRKSQNKGESSAVSLLSFSLLLTVTDSSADASFLASEDSGVKDCRAAVSILSALRLLPFASRPVEMDLVFRFPFHPYNSKSFDSIHFGYADVLLPFI